jgi:hypothetical protein
VTGRIETSPSALTQTGRFELGRERAQRLARQGLAFTGGYTAASLWCAVGGLSPLYTLPLALATGLVLARPRQVLRAPLVVAASLAAAAGAAWLGLPAAFAVAAVVGALASMGRGTLDLVNGAFAGVAGLGAGLLAVGVLNMPVLAETAIAGALAAVLLVPSALLWRPRANVPTRRHIELTLKAPYRPSPMRAREVFEHLGAQKPDAETLDGLAEVSMWVYDLARSLQALDHELEHVDHDDLVDRIELLRMEADECEDEFTRDRQLATARHLQSLLGHAEQIRLERERSRSMQDYALAYLEEARMGLALARTLPGEATPSRLGEVLDRLRGHAMESDTRRRTNREVGLA